MPDQPVCHKRVWLRKNKPAQSYNYCRLIRIALMQNQERSMRLISNMCFLASCAYNPCIR